MEFLDICAIDASLAADLAAKIAADEADEAAIPKRTNKPHKKTAYEKKKKTFSVGRSRANSPVLNFAPNAVQAGKMRNHALPREYANLHGARLEKMNDRMDSQMVDYLIPEY